MLSQSIRVPLHQNLPFFIRHVSRIERGLIAGEAESGLVLSPWPVLLISIYKDSIRHDKRYEVRGLFQSLLVKTRNEVQNLLLVLYGSAVPLLQTKIDFHPERGKSVTGTNAGRCDSVGHNRFIAVRGRKVSLC